MPARRAGLLRPGLAARRGRHAVGTRAALPVLVDRLPRRRRGHRRVARRRLRGPGRHRRLRLVRRPPTTPTRTPRPASWTTTRNGGRSSPSPAAWTGSRSCPGSPASPSPSPNGDWTSTASAARTTPRSSPGCLPGCTPTTRSASTGPSSTWPRTRPCRPARCWPAWASTRATRKGSTASACCSAAALQYAEAFLSDQKPLSDSTAQPALAPWQHAGYQLILSVPLIPLTGPSAASPPEPGQPYQLADYPDALAAFHQGLFGTGHT